MIIDGFRKARRRRGNLHSELLLHILKVDQMRGGSLKASRCAAQLGDVVFVHLLRLALVQHFVQCSDVCLDHYNPPMTTVLQPNINNC